MCKLEFIITDLSNLNTLAKMHDMPDNSNGSKFCCQNILLLDSVPRACVVVQVMRTKSNCLSADDTDDTAVCVKLII